MKSFSDIFIDCTSAGTKIPKESYLDSGMHIIIDQGQNEIAGYTNEETGLYTDVPAIIFGDHTRAVKYVEEPFFLGADGVKLLKSKVKDANYKYLYYALKNAKIPDTGYNRHFKWLKEIEINYPAPSVQSEIVKTLDSLTTIISYRENELSKLDELIKARFVEMFGDPSDNSRTDRVELSEICEKITDGEHGSVTRVPSGHPFLNAKHILKNGRIDWETITYVSDEDHQRIYKRCNPVEGDILLTTTGTIGNVAIMPKFEEVSMDRGITLLKIDRKKVTSEFVAELLKQPSIQTEMGVNVHASAIGHLFMNKVKKLPAILPSMERQAEFTDFVRQVDKSKVVVQQALKETRLLFDKMVQEYFG